MNKSNLLVTGSSGYLGSHLLSELAKTNKYNLTGLDFIATSKYLNSGNVYLHLIKLQTL